MAQSPLSPNLPAGRSTEFNPQISVGQNNAEKTNSSTDPNTGAGSLAENFETSFTANPNGADYLRSEAFLENSIYDVDTARLFAESDEDDSMDAVFVSESGPTRMGPLYATPREEISYPRRESSRNWNDGCFYSPSRFHQYESMLTSIPCVRLPDPHFREETYSYPSHSRYIHSHSLMDEYPSQSHPPPRDGYEPSQSTHNRYVSFPPLPRLRRAVLPRTLQTCSSPIPYHHRNNIDAYDIETYGLDNPSMQRIPGEQSASSSFITSCSTGADTIPRGNINDHINRAISVRNASTSTPPDLALISSPGSVHVAYGAVTVSRKRGVGDAAEGSCTKIMKHDNIRGTINTDSSTLTDQQQSTSSQLPSNPPPLLATHPTMSIVTTTDSNAENHSSSINTTAASSTLTSSSTVNKVPQVDSEPRMKTETSGVKTSMLSGPELELITSTLAPSSKSSSRGSSTKSSPSLSRASPNHVPAYSQEALRDLVCATLAPAAAATLIKNEKREKEQKRKSIVVETEPQPGTSGLQDVDSTLQHSPTVLQHSRTGPPKTSSSGAQSGSVDISEPTPSTSGLQSSFSTEQASDLGAPDLQLDCLSSDSEDSSSEDVQVVKIPRKKGRRQPRLPVEVDLTQEMTSDEDDIRVEEVKSNCRSVNISSEVTVSVSSESMVNNEVTEAEIVAEPNPGFFHTSEAADGVEMSTYQRLRQLHHSHSVLMEPHQPPLHHSMQELGDHEPAVPGSSSDFRPRRLRHPWNYEVNRCYHGQFHNPVSCPCREQHDIPDGGFYQTPPPAHRSSLYPGNMPDSSGLGRNRLLRAVQRMNPRHQRLWQMQNNHQEQMRRQMAPARTAPPATLPVTVVEGRAEVQQPIPVEGIQEQQPGMSSSGANVPPGLQESHTREGARPMITVPRIMIGSRPSTISPMQNPPPAHLQSGQQRMFEDPSGRYRRYQQSLHRWHTPVMPDPPTLAFHPGLEDSILPQYPVPHYHNPWNSNPNLRAHINLPDPELGVMIPRPAENYPRGLENYGGIANFLLQPRSMVGIEVIFLDFENPRFFFYKIRDFFWFCFTMYTNRKCYHN